LANQVLCKKYEREMLVVANIAPRADEPGAIAFWCAGCETAHTVLIHSDRRADVNRAPTERGGERR
jgi:hypothetical protein